MVFNVKKPASAIDGITSGTGNIVKGTLVGVVAWGAITVVETKDRGCIGCASGFGKGFFVMIGLSLVGVFTGLAQVIKGIFNTPSAIKNAIEGKEFNEDTREWYFYHLEEEKKQFLEKTDEQYIEDLKKQGKPVSSNRFAEAKKKMHKTDVKETELYDILGVSPNAT